MISPNFIWAKHLLRLTLIVFAGALSLTEARTQSFTEFPTGGRGSSPLFITTGSDGALWYTEIGAIGRMASNGAHARGPIPIDILSVNGRPERLVQGSDGAIWFTYTNRSIGRITTAGVLREFVLDSDSKPGGIASGHDGRLWVTDTAKDKIWRITTSGGVTSFPLPAGSGAKQIVSGPDGALWFVKTSVQKIGRISTAGVLLEDFPFFGPVIAFGADGSLWFTDSAGVSRFRLAPPFTGTRYAIGGVPFDLTTGPDGAMWVTRSAPIVDGSAAPGSFSVALVRIGLNGSVSTPLTGQVTSAPAGIALGPDNALWFTEQGKPQPPGNPDLDRIARYAPARPAGETDRLLSAVLPSSRSVQVAGNADVATSQPDATVATAFATLINSSPNAVDGCVITPVTQIPADFQFQKTNPATNAVIGAANEPAAIGPNAAQSFVIALKPTAAFVPTDVTFGFTCNGTNAADISLGLNTLLLSASADPIADMVALAATSTGDGILHIRNGAAAFAVATVNVGSTSSITVSADTGAATLPVAISVCQTDPQLGTCTSAIGPSVTTQVPAGTTPTFAIFASTTGAVPADFANNRVVVRFRDSAGITRGSTSVAVLTD